jgi:hypothetical protein
MLRTFGSFLLVFWMLSLVVHASAIGHFLGGAPSHSSQLMGCSRNSLEIRDLLERLNCRCSKMLISLLDPKALAQSSP